QGRTVAVVQFHDRIGQGRGNLTGERWSHRAQEHVDVRVPVSGDETGDQNVIPGLDKAARGEVSQLGVIRWIQVIGLDHGGADAVVLAADDGRVSARIKDPQDG